MFAQFLINLRQVLLIGLLALSASSNIFAATVWTNPVNLGSAINSSADDSGPNLSADALTMYLHSNRTGGSGGFDLYQSSRATVNSAWEPAVNLGTNINTAGNERSATTTSDGLTLFFSSDVSGNANLYTSTRATTNDAWGIATSLGAVVNEPGIDNGPSLSSDGLSLYFHTDRNGGNPNIFETTRVSLSDPWLTPIGLGSTVNSSLDFDIAPDISSDGLTLYFHSTRVGGPGTHNIWATERLSLLDPWTAPYLLASPVNSIGNALGANISNDSATLFFTSDRAGGIDDSRDIWMVTAAPVVAVPIPSVFWFIGSGLLVFIAFVHRRMARLV